MSEPGGWTTPEGWGPPSTPEAPPYGQAPPSGQAPSSGQAPPYGQAPAYGGQPGYGPPPPYGAPPWGSPPQNKPGVVPLRPLGLGEILDGAVGILRRYARPALGLSAIVAVVTSLLNVVVQLVAFRPLFEVDQGALERGDTAALEDALGGLVAGAGLTAVVSLLSTAVMTGIITVVVGKAVLGQPLSFGQAWAQVRPRILALIGLSLLVLVAVYGVIVGAAAVSGLIIGLAGGIGAIVAVPLILAALAYGVFLYFRWSLAPCVLVLERASVRASLRRSAVLVKGDWWRVLGILLLTSLIGGTVGAIVQIPFGLFGAGGIGDFFDPGADALSFRALTAGAIGGALSLTLIAPFTAGVRALLYVDRRIRAEGLDVSLAAAAAEGPTAT